MIVLGTDTTVPSVSNFGNPFMSFYTVCKFGEKYINLTESQMSLSIYIITYIMYALF